MTTFSTKAEREYIRKLTTEGRPVRNVVYALSVLGKFLAGGSFSLGIQEAQNFVSWCLNEYHLQPQSVNDLITKLISFYDYLVEKSQAAVNPFLLVDRPKVGYRLPKDIPGENDLMAILFELSHVVREGEPLRKRIQRYKVHVIVEVLYSTGVRISELAQVRITDVDFQNRMVKITDCKAHRKRMCIMSEYASIILKTYVGLRDHLLQDPSSPLLFGSKSYIKVYVNKALKACCLKLGLSPISCHSLRHAFAYHLLKAGCDIRKIQSLMGHKYLSSTQVYAKVDTESLKAVLDRFHPRTLKRVRL